MFIQNKTGDIKMTYETIESAIKKYNDSINKIGMNTAIDRVKETYQPDSYYNNKWKDFSKRNTKRVYSLAYARI